MQSRRVRIGDLAVAEVMQDSLRVLIAMKRGVHAVRSGFEVVSYFGRFFVKRLYSRLTVRHFCFSARWAVAFCLISR